MSLGVNLLEIGFHRKAQAIFFNMVPYERGEFTLREPDAFTRGLFSLVGLGTLGLRERMRVALRDEEDGIPRETILGRIDDLTPLWFSGFLAHRPRNALSLEAMPSKKSSRTSRAWSARR